MVMAKGCWLVVALLLPRLALAQADLPFERLADQLNAGDRVRIVDATGRVRDGDVVALEPGPEHWAIMRDLMRESGTAGSLVSDAHLAALAIERGAELCSADADFARYPRLRWVDPVR